MIEKKEGVIFLEHELSDLEAFYSVENDALEALTFSDSFDKVMFHVTKNVSKLSHSIMSGLESSTICNEESQAYHRAVISFKELFRMLKDLKEMKKEEELSVSSRPFQFYTEKILGFFDLSLRESGIASKDRERIFDYVAANIDGWSSKVEKEYTVYKD